MINIFKNIPDTADCWNCGTSSDIMVIKIVQDGPFVSAYGSDSIPYKATYKLRHSLLLLCDKCRAELAIELVKSLKDGGAE